MALPFKKPRSFEQVQKNFENMEPRVSTTEDNSGGNRIVRGVVNSTGTIAEGSGFSVVKNGTGDYTITFSPQFSDAPAVVATARGLAPMILANLGSAATVSSVNVRTRTDAAVSTDAEFHFIAIGPN